MAEVGIAFALAKVAVGEVAWLNNFVGVLAEEPPWVAQPSGRPKRALVMQPPVPSGGEVEPKRRPREPRSQNVTVCAYPVGVFEGRLKTQPAEGLVPAVGLADARSN